MTRLRRDTTRWFSILTLAVAPVQVFAQDLREVLQPFVDRQALAGAVVLVADRERILNVAAVGFADVAAGKPMTTDALFWIASESKPITATALMMLVDEGRVGLDDPVAKYLPEFAAIQVAAPGDQPPAPPDRPITLRDLLSHTSGLPFSSPIETPTLDGLSLADATRSYARLTLSHQPGSKYQYSNAGINTVGRIIEVVSGQSYETFLQTRLFDPLGMVDTTFRPTHAQQSRLALSYQPNSAKNGLEPTTISQLHYPLDDPSRQPMPAGGLFSTAADLARFARMILNGGMLDGRRFLTEESVRAMTSKQTGPKVKESYGLGWSIGDHGNFGHAGAYATDLTIDPARGLILIHMVQHAGFPRDGDRVLSQFHRAARDRFGASKP